MTHPERVRSRAQLLDQVWGDHVFVEERTVDVHIRRLRSRAGAVPARQPDPDRARHRLSFFCPAVNGAPGHRAAHHTFLACCAGFCGLRDMQRRRSFTPPARQNSGMIRFALRKDVHASLACSLYWLAGVGTGNAGGAAV